MFLYFGDLQTNRWTGPLHEAVLNVARGGLIMLPQCRKRRLNNATTQARDMLTRSMHIAFSMHYRPCTNSAVDPFIVLRPLHNFRPGAECVNNKTSTISILRMMKTWQSWQFTTEI